MRDEFEPRLEGSSSAANPKLTKHQQAEALARIAQGETLIPQLQGPTTSVT
jgi:hypothetical protein